MSGYRPQPVWILTGPLAGALAGAITGAAVLLVVALVDPTGTFTGSGGAQEAFWAVGALIVIGGWFGGIAGLAVGLVVGVEMAFLVGSHLPREVARRRARVLGHVLPPLTMAAPVLATTWAHGGDVSSGTPGLLWWATALVGASTVGGPLARWLAGAQTARTVVS